ncbi:MAG: hypothetical protein AMXMBFR52_01890 [Burkholderiales bacterium]
MGGADEAIDSAGVDDIGGLLGAVVGRVPRTGVKLKGDVGRYVRSAEPDGSVARHIYIDQAQPPEKAVRIQAHETGHLLDDHVFGIMRSGGNKIPIDGLHDELRRIYKDLNTAGHFKPGRGATPIGAGYSPNEAGSELMAEAIRAYLRDPNYLETVAPKTAARIREYVNANSNLNKVIGPAPRDRRL